MATPHLKSRAAPLPTAGLPPARAEVEDSVVLGRLLAAQKLASLGALAGSLAHDFNNFFTVIIGRGELAAAVTTDPAVQRHLHEILATARRAAELGRGVLGYASEEQTTPCLIEPGPWLRQHLPLFEVALSRRIELALEIDDQLPPLRIIPGALQQALVHLVLNAVESMGDAEGVLTLAVRLTTTAGDGGWRGAPLAGRRAIEFSVSDTGPGLAPEVPAAAGTPFFTTKPGAAGLGLTTLLALVRPHEGALLLEPLVPHGARARLAFPVASSSLAHPVIFLEDPVSSPASPATALTADPAGTPAAAPRYALIVDDEVAMREMLATLLEHSGLQILCAANGDEAVNLYRQYQGEIAHIFLDLRMPGMSGEETCEEMHAIAPLPHLVVMSGFVASLEEVSLPAGVDARFLSKPFDLVDLLALLDNTH